MAVHYPADYNVFALVTVEDPLTLPRDKGLIRGSGTTGEACMVTDRNYILIDNDIDSIDKSAERLGVTFYTQFT